jgi:hypothetical protein
VTPQFVILLEGKSLNARRIGGAKLSAGASSYKQS